jgi:hypothetical protein
VGFLGGAVWHGAWKSESWNQRNVAEVSIAGLHQSPIPNSHISAEQLFTFTAVEELQGGVFSMMCNSEIYREPVS